MTQSLKSSQDHRTEMEFVQEGDMSCCVSSTDNSNIILGEIFLE